MKKPRQGPSLYYASDKNIFDALNQSKVDNETVQEIFVRRNIVCSKKTPREELAKFFSRLVHDSLDHESLSRKLGVIARRERVTAIQLVGKITGEDLSRAMTVIKEDLEKDGDSVILSGTTNPALNVQYTTIDYKRSEFSQLQNKDGDLEFVKENDGYVIRSTQNEYINKIRDALIVELQKTVAEPIEKINIQLSTVTSPAARSKFFYDLMMDLPGYVRRDVTDVYVYKPRPSRKAAGDEDEDGATEDTHVEKVLMRGNGVSQSKILSDLQSEKYYICRVGWLATELLGQGFGFEIEVMFQDATDCRDFSYILRGVYELDDDGKLQKKRRPATKSEIDTVSRVVEEKAKELTNAAIAASKSPGG